MLEDIAFLLGDVPFRPFHLVTSDGKDYRIDSPKQLTLPEHGRSVHYTRKEGHLMMISVRHILRIEVAEHR